MRRAHRASRDARLSTGDERALDRPAASKGLASKRPTARWVGAVCEEVRVGETCLVTNAPMSV
jgi:hypothetical protein